MPESALKTALVLGGGGARGAYEAGVVSFLRDELEPGLGRRLPLHILSGTSVGAINACHLASYTDVAERAACTLCERWRSLQAEHILNVGARDVLRMTLETAGITPRILRGDHGGLLSSEGLRAVVMKSARWSALHQNIRSGKLDALCISATHVATGRTYTFVERRLTGVPASVKDAQFVMVPTRIGVKHALASAAIPLLFPPVRIGKQLFVDGGLTFNVPISPALRLGADRVIVVSLRRPSSAQDIQHGVDNERALVTAPFLAGKALNALLLDRTEQDVQELRRINSLLEAGLEAFGPQFAGVVNRAFAPSRSQPMRYVRNVLVHPSRDLGELAADYARSPTFKARARGVAGRVLRMLAEREARSSADLVSYLLFDGEFADHLIELGRADARALGDEWARFFSEEPQSPAERLGQRPRAAG